MKVYKYYKKKNIKSLLLVLALFFLLVSMSVVSYAWIEGSSAVDITNNTNTIKFNNTNTTVNLSTTSYELPLSDYIDNSGSLFLAPAYSSDGKTIQIKRGSADSTLENATVNDIGVNYIEFSLKVKTSAAATYGYTTDSAITVDGEATDAVKVSTQIGTGTALAYDGTGLASQKAFELSGSGTYVLTTRIWCDKDKFSSIQGKNISFNLHLKKMYKVTVNAVANGTVSTDGGVIALDEDRSDVSGTATLSKYVVDGSKISIDAVANSGYTFAGWYSAVTGGTKYDYSDTEEITVSSEVNVYARFLGQFTIYGKVSTNSSASNTNGGTISIDGGTAGTSVSKPVNYGTSVTLKATAASGYRFVGWATTASGTVTSTDTSLNVNVNKDGITYFARFMQRFSVDAYVVTDGSSSNTKGGTVTAGSSSTGSTTVDYGTNVTVTATANSGYKFDGWYTSATGGTQLTTSTSYTFSSVKSNQKAYARFTTYNTTIYLRNNKGWSAPYAHTWNEAGSTSTWPGDAMTKVKFDIYKVTIPGDRDHVKFSNNSSDATGDLTIPTDGKNCYDALTGTWSVYDSTKHVITVGVISYIDSSGTATNYKVHYWGGSATSDATCTSLGMTVSKSVGSSYWSGNAQTFHMYQATIPADATGFKFYIDSTSDTWFGDDGDATTKSSVYAFNYSGNKALYE